MWAQIAGAVAGPVVSSLAGKFLARGELKEANKLHNEAVRGGRRFIDRAEDFARMADETWEFYRDYGQPLDATVAREAMAQYQRGPEDAVKRATSDVNTAYDRAEDIRMRQQSRYGEVDPLSGAAQAGRRQTALDRAATEVDARGRARLIEEERGFNRLLAASQQVGNRAAINANMFGRTEAAMRGRGIDAFTGGATRMADSAAGIQETVGNIAARVPWQDVVDQVWPSEGNGVEGAPGNQGGAPGYQAPGMAQGGLVQAIPAPLPNVGRQVVGPGTGTSDSIPAVIDGQQPTALSTGEFVIPAAVVRRKGTEFFEKLIAQENQNGVR